MSFHEVMTASINYNYISKNSADSRPLENVIFNTLDFLLLTATLHNLIGGHKE